MRTHLKSLGFSGSLALVALLQALPGTCTATEIAPGTKLQQAAQARLEAYLQNGQIPAAAGIFRHGRYLSVTAGERDRTTHEPVTEATLFPLGSITKVFTGIMIGYLLNEGRIDLDDPVVLHLPNEVKLRGGAIRNVSWLDLATHTSGMSEPAAGNPAEQAYFDLPPLPNLISQWIEWKPAPPLDGDPYLYQYSNLGFLTLAFAVAHAGGRGGYNGLFDEVFKQPLRLQYLQTLGSMTPAVRAFLTSTYGAEDDPFDRVGNGINANLIDLGPFLSACLLDHGTPNRLEQAIAKSQQPYRSKLADNPDRWMGLGWDLRLDTPYSISKGGATAGAFSSLQLRPQENIGVIVMANGRHPDGNAIGKLADDLVDLVIQLGEPELAHGRPTQQSGGSGKNLPNDGKKTRERYWSGDEPEAWWQVDLESPRAVNFIHVLPVWDTVPAPSYSVSTSLDGNQWTRVIDHQAASRPSTQAGHGYPIEAQYARYVRVDRATSPLQLIEVEVFEDADTAPAAMRLAQPTLEHLPATDPRAAPWRFSFRRLVADDRLNFQPSVSTDLRVWRPMEEVFGPPNLQRDPAGVSERVSWEWKIDPSAEAARFLRLRIDSR